MPNVYSHHPDKKRHYHGEELAQSVLEFMRDDGPLQRRVASHLAGRLSPEQILKHAAKLEKGRARVAEVINCLKAIFGKPFRGRGENERELGTKMRRCNRLLGKYKVYWLVGPALSESDTGSQEEALNRATFGFIEIVAPQRPIVSPQECHAVRAVMRLSELGALQKLKTCEECGLWFYARFEHQRFCTKSCQIKHHTSSERWKEYKRNKAREYYQLHKAGKVRER
jgi:hypothetical protein